MSISFCIVILWTKRYTYFATPAGARWREIGRGEWRSLIGCGGKDGVCGGEQPAWELGVRSIHRPAACHTEHRIPMGRRSQWVGKEVSERFCKTMELHFVLFMHIIGVRSLNDLSDMSEWHYNRFSHRNLTDSYQGVRGLRSPCLGPSPSYDGSKHIWFR